MLPIVIDPKFLKVLVSGKGPATTNRLKMLEVAKVTQVKYVENEPNEKDFEGVNIAYIADFDDETSERIAGIARAKNIILNIEDKKKFCDFHVPSIVRRGDLLLTISTAGKSPRIARRLRIMFQSMFSDKWSEELDNIGELREKWKAKGFGYKELADSTDEYIYEKSLMLDFCDKCQKNSK